MGNRREVNPSSERLGQIGGRGAGGAQPGERRIVAVHDQERLTAGSLGSHVDLKGFDDGRQRSKRRNVYCNKQLQKNRPLRVVVLNPEAGYRRTRWMRRMVPREVRVNRYRVVMVRRVIA